MNPLLGRLQPYPFERLRALLAGATPPADLPAIPMYIGEPRHAAPAFVLDAYSRNLETLGNYPATLGLPQLRATIASWLERRFQLAQGTVNPDTMVLPVNGTREALFSFAQATIDASSKPLVAMPNPFYQIYEGAALLAGAEPYFMPTAQDTGLPDLDNVPEDAWRRCQLLYLCSPSNPTGAVASSAYLQRALELAHKFDFVIASDECYSELYFDEANPPPGLLQAAHAMGNTTFERCVVFHSLSKRSSLPGLRSGFVAGDARILKPFLLYRTYHGCAMSVHTQLISIMCWNDEAHVAENRRLYREKFAAVLPILRDALPVEEPQASFYLWPSVPDDEQFVRQLFERKHVTLLPGSYLARQTTAGNPGRNRVRISLVAQLPECVQAAERIRDFIVEARR
jgi:N-succinyldiaminopimelate aminotransferase